MIYFSLKTNFFKINEEILIEIITKFTLRQVNYIFFNTFERFPEKYTTFLYRKLTKVISL